MSVQSTFILAQSAATAQPKFGERRGPIMRPTPPLAAIGGAKMKTFVSLVIAMSLVVTTVWFSCPGSFAQQSTAAPPKDDDPVAKGLKKNWDKLPPEAKLAADPKVKAAWEKLSPKQHALLRSKVQEIIKGATAKYQQTKANELAQLKTWDDVLKKQGSGEDEILTFTDSKGKSHTVKAKSRDASIKLIPNKTVGSSGRKASPNVWEMN